MKRKKSITFRLSEKTIKAIEELSKRYELKKSQVIERIMKNIIDTELEKILIIDNIKPLLPQIIRVSPTINLLTNTSTKTEIQETTQKPEKEEKIQKEEKQPEKTTEKKNKEETNVKKTDDSFWEFSFDDVL